MGERGSGLAGARIRPQPMKRGSAMSSDVDRFRCSLKQHVSPWDAKSVLIFINALEVPEEELQIPVGLQSRKYARVVRLALDTIVEDVNRIAGELIEEYNSELDEVPSVFKQNLQALFDHLAGSEFGSLSRNKEVTKALQSLLSRYGYRVRCPRESCGRPAYIRCVAAGRAKHGAFYFDHSVNGKQTTHGGVGSLPELQVVFAPILLTRAGRRPS